VITCPQNYSSFTEIRNGFWVISCVVIPVTSHEAEGYLVSSSSKIGYYQLGPRADMTHATTAPILGLPNAQRPLGRCTYLTGYTSFVTAHLRTLAPNSHVAELHECFQGRYTVGLACTTFTGARNRREEKISQAA
jgi:hypothetical protein